VPVRAEAAGKPIVQVWQTKLHGFGSAVSVGKTTVLLTTKAHRLYLTGLASASGREIWSQEMSPGDVPGGMPVGFTVVAGHVAYLRPWATLGTGALGAQLVVADAATGRELVATGSYSFVSTPDECDDRPDAICAHVLQAGLDTAMVLPPGSRDFVFDPVESHAAAHRSIGSDGLSDLLVRNPEQIAVIRKGKIVWKHRLSDIFEDDRSTDFGWDFEKTNKSGLFVGSVGWDALRRMTGVMTIPLPAASITAGFRSSDGAALWKDLGSQLHCGDTLAIPMPAGSDTPDYPVRCRYSGSVTVTRGGSEQPVTTDLFVTIERFDPVTGKTIWSAPVGDAPSLLNAASEGAQPAQLDDHSVVVATRHGSVVLDLNNGRTRATTSTDVAWCRSGPTVKYHIAQFYDGVAYWDRLGDQLATPCNASGGPARYQPTATPSSGSTEVAGRLTVVVGPDTVTAYRAG
jgi:hypothetical protein